MFNSAPNKPVIAAFDFDGTITTRDSLLPFLFFSNGRITTLKKLAVLSPVFLKYFTGFNSRQQTKETVLGAFFKTMPLSWLMTLGELFAQSPHLDHLIRPEAKERIKWHLQQGHRCILISASINIYLNPWAKSFGFQDVISSRLKITKEGIVMGDLEGLNCWGPEKVRRLNELLGPRENYTLYAYGDSRGDQELLAAADFPFYRQIPPSNITV
ncbi:MAG: HAD family hydrolase [Parachlamydiaceae bacterium]|nr:HAD family hydrolase [Parachlamydiaceae bacterium]